MKECMRYIAKEGLREMAEVRVYERDGQNERRYKRDDSNKDGYEGINNSEGRYDRGEEGIREMAFDEVMRVMERMKMYERDFRIKRDYYRCQK